MKILAALLCLIQLQPLSAQDWKPASADELLSRLDASAAKYKGMEHYEARTTLLVYARAGDAQPSERGESRVWKVGTRAKADHLGMISYQNEKVRVTIDKDDRVMVLAEPEEYVGLMGLEERRAILGMASDIHVHAGVDGVHYRVRFPKGSEYDEVLFAFDPSGWLRRMETQWGNAVPLIPDNPLTDVILPRVVMELEPPRRIDPANVKADPSEAVAFVNGKPQPTAAYRDFMVIDNRLRP